MTVGHNLNCTNGEYVPRADVSYKPGSSPPPTAREGGGGFRGVYCFGVLEEERIHNHVECT